MIDSLCSFSFCGWAFFYGWSFLLWSFHIGSILRANTCYRFSAIFVFFCVTTVKFLHSLRLFEIFLLNYCSASVTELHHVLIHFQTKHYLNTIPHYTLSYYITVLKAILMYYRIIPHVNALLSYTLSWNLGEVSFHIALSQNSMRRRINFPQA